jgi:hypothetical protein
VIVNADVNASAAIAGTKISPDFGSQNVVTTGNLQGASINGGPLAGFRNRIINGDFAIGQRGLTFAALATGAYFLDRWSWLRSGAMVCTLSQSGDVPNTNFQFSCKADVTTADTSIGTTDRAAILHRIEGFNVRDLIGNTFTISFWVKSPKTGTHCVALRNSIADRSYIATYTVSVANTWEFKTITITGGLITAGTWNWGGGIGLELAFTLAAGTTYQTTAGAWQTGNFFGTSAQVNTMDNTLNDFFLAGVQLEAGPVATPFEQRPIGLELGLCQRYYEPITPINTIFYAQTSNVLFTFIKYITKRNVPTITFANTTSNVAIYGLGSSTTFNGTYTTEGVSDHCSGINVVTSTSVLVPGEAGRLQNSANIFVSAEL